MIRKRTTVSYESGGLTWHCKEVNIEKENVQVQPEMNVNVQQEIFILL